MLHCLRLPDREVLSGGSFGGVRSVRGLHATAGDYHHVCTVRHVVVPLCQTLMVMCAYVCVHVCKRVRVCVHVCVCRVVQLLPSTTSATATILYSCSWQS